jgi:hypothetical protein
MQKDERDLLEVLKFELNYLEKGGYGRSPREPWRPQYIFEDSPTCMNFDCKENPAPCSDCVLMHWIPPEQRNEKIPCRHIPLGPSGETLDYLYRWGDQHEIEESVQTWLRATIAGLEEERKTLPPVEHNEHASDGQAVTDLPLCQNLHPKCANPACPTPFHWLAGGKFFRFRTDQISASVCDPPKGLPVGPHGVHHYWLCERCSHIFTLVHRDECGVVLNLLWGKSPLAQADGELPAARARA